MEIAATTATALPIRAARAARSYAAVRAPRIRTFRLPKGCATADAAIAAATPVFPARPFKTVAVPRVGVPHAPAVKSAIRRLAVRQIPEPAPVSSAGRSRMAAAGRFLAELVRVE